MYPNVKASEQIAVLDTIAMPTAGTTASTVTTGWINAANFNKFLAIVSTGVLGAAATVDAKFQQASDSGGTGAKDVTNKAITQIVKASGDNKEATIDLDAQELDVTNGFSYIRLSVTVGTATSAVAAQVLGFVPRNATAAALNNANVVQQV